MESLFSELIPSNNKEFLLFRDSPNFFQQRKYCESLWKKYQKFSDPDFPIQFAQEIHPRFWEMYLGNYFSHLGIILQPKSKSHGPDINFYYNERRYWIEATSSSEGVGPDAVPSLKENDKFDLFPEEKIILRFTNSISEKKGKFLDYLGSFIIGGDDVLIIAINGGQIGRLRFFESISSRIPTIVKALFPIGNLTVDIDRETSEITKQEYKKRLAVIKRLGSPVETTSFLNPEYSIISGVLYSHVNVIDMPVVSKMNFIFIHNLYAENSIPIGTLDVCHEFFIEDDELMILSH